MFYPCPRQIAYRRKSICFRFFCMSNFSYFTGLVGLYMRVLKHMNLNLEIFRNLNKNGSCEYETFCVFVLDFVFVFFSK